MSREIWIKNELNKTVLYVGIYRGGNYAEIRKDNPDLIARFLRLLIGSECKVITEEEAEYLVTNNGYSEICNAVMGVAEAINHTLIKENDES